MDDFKNDLSIMLISGIVIFFTLLIVTEKPPIWTFKEIFWIATLLTAIGTLFIVGIFKYDETTTGSIQN